MVCDICNLDKSRNLFISYSQNHFFFPSQFVHMNLKQPGFPDTSLDGPDLIVMNGDPHPPK